MVIESLPTNPISRRDFLKLLGLAAAAGLAGDAIVFPRETQAQEYIPTGEQIHRGGSLRIVQTLPNGEQTIGQAWLSYSFNPTTNTPLVEINTVAHTVIFGSLLEVFVPGVRNPMVFDASRVRVSTENSDGHAKIALPHNVATQILSLDLAPGVAIRDWGSFIHPGRVVVIPQPDTDTFTVAEIVAVGDTHLELQTVFSDLNADGTPDPLGGLCEGTSGGPLILTTAFSADEYRRAGGNIVSMSITTTPHPAQLPVVIGVVQGPANHEEHMDMQGTGRRCNHATFAIRVDPTYRYQSQ